MDFIKPPNPNRFYADKVCDRIEKQIANVQGKLKEGQSLSVEFLLADGSSVIPTFIGFQIPNFVIVDGEDANGNNISVLLSHTNIQVMITTLNKPDDRKPIGFQH